MDIDQLRQHFPDENSCRQFTVTTKTPLHSTKLSLWKWLEAMYLIISSSKGISSVVLARWLGVTQPTAWKMGHAIRKMMNPNQSEKRGHWFLS
jgi:transposase-like protein